MAAETGWEQSGWARLARLRVGGWDRNDQSALRVDARAVQAAPIPVQQADRAPAVSHSVASGLLYMGPRRAA